MSNNKAELRVVEEYLLPALKVNRCLINFDLRKNPGFVEGVQKQVALCLLRNLEKIKQEGI